MSESFLRVYRIGPWAWGNENITVNTIPKNITIAQSTAIIGMDIIERTIDVFFVVCHPDKFFLLFPSYKIFSVYPHSSLSFSPAIPVLQPFSTLSARSALSGATTPLSFFYRSHHDMVSTLLSVHLCIFRRPPVLLRVSVRAAGSPASRERCVRM